jgi:Leucine-rich repeat (LRR) protein
MLYSQPLGNTMWTSSALCTNTRIETFEEYDTNEEVIDCSRNQAYTISPDIGRFKNHKEQYLEAKGLQTLPKEIGELRSLLKLDLSGNRLSSLPGSFGNLINLRKLRLTGNRLSKLPESFQNLANLREIDLSKNRLQCLPGSFRNLAETLVWVKLTGNNIVERGVDGDLGRVELIATLGDCVVF